MQFVIVGAGRVGLRTARTLEESDHDVVIVDSDSDAVARARAHGFEVVVGDGGRESTYESLDLSTVEGFGALTGDMNTNLAACAIGHRAGCRTVMRIDEAFREQRYRTGFDEIDTVVHPERLGGVLARNALVGGNSRAVADVDRDLQVVEFTVTDRAPMCGYTLAELELPGPARLIAFGPDGGQLDVPETDATLTSGDRLVVLVATDRIADVRRIVVGKSERVRREA
jgi:trk system potassium uptake protein TrkA